MNLISSQLKRRASRFTAMALGLLLPAMAQAVTLQVQCGADPATLPPGTYSTIAAALSALPSSGPNSIIITGTCAEHVFIDNRDGLTLEGPTGQSATVAHPPVTPKTSVFVIARSRAITLRRLSVQDGSPGIRVRDLSEVNLTDVAVENNAGGGLIVESGSVVQTGGSFASRTNLGLGVSLNNGSLTAGGAVTVENNGNGITVANNSIISMGRGDGTAPVRINGNNGGGLGVINNSLANLNGDIVIENNVGTGINLANSRLNMGTGIVQSVIRGNGGAIVVGDVSSAIINGDTLIQNNGAGIQVSLSSGLTLNSQPRPDGTVKGVVIEGHSGPGLNILAGSTASVNGLHIIRNNGGAAPLPVFATGIRVSSAMLFLTGPVEVSGNAGPGILAEFGALVRIGGLGPNLPSPVVITGNSGEGIQMTFLSATRLLQPTTVSGNLTGSITCDGSSWLFGDANGIADVKCNNSETLKKK